MLLREGGEEIRGGEEKGRGGEKRRGKGSNQSDGEAGGAEEGRRERWNELKCERAFKGGR